MAGSTTFRIEAGRRPGCRGSKRPEQTRRGPPNRTAEPHPRRRIRPPACHTRAHALIRDPAKDGIPDGQVDHAEPPLPVGGAEDPTARPGRPDEGGWSIRHENERRSGHRASRGAAHPHRKRRDSGTASPGPTRTADIAAALQARVVFGMKRQDEGSLPFVGHAANAILHPTSPQPASRHPRNLTSSRCPVNSSVRSTRRVLGVCDADQSRSVGPLAPSCDGIV